jgi:DNA invertase Pin-like site-specific DNA recombinase
MAACREGDTLVVTKLDRLARSLPDARAIADELTARQEAHLVGLLQAGEHSTAELADLFGVARSTVYRAQQRHQAAARP